jgi:hypothetical protein
MLKGAESIPKPMGDQREKQTVAITATVGGATNIEIKFAKSQLCPVFEFLQPIFECAIEFSTKYEY